MAVTGEISLNGLVRPVGGVFEKAYGAKQAGIKTLIIPKENDKDIPKGHLGLNIHAVETAEEAFGYIFADEHDSDKNAVAEETIEKDETANYVKTEDTHPTETVVSLNKEIGEYGESPKEHQGEDDGD